MKPNRVQPFKPCGNKVKPRKALPVSRKQAKDNLISKLFKLKTDEKN
jgi:hypothetical protein